jgi:dolichol-phosphate mannosyltransferase
MKHITIISPAYNEAEGIAHFYRALAEELSKITGYLFSIVLVDDGSRDGTFEAIEKIVAIDARVHAIRFSRNFGHQNALLAGIDEAGGDAIIMMDSDLQHPPAMLPKLLAEYEKGFDVVYTVRADSSDVGFLRRTFGGLFYWGVNLISEVPIHQNASDFRLISGCVAELIRTKIRERNLFLRGIISWIGFSQTGLSYTADPRIAGKSKYSLRRLIEFAIFGVISFSKKPLRVAIIVGMLVALFGFLFALVTVIQVIVGNPFPAGWATVVVLVSIFGGIQLFFLGVIGEYIGGIFDEVKGRPHYIIQDSVGV